ncbi:unnamed protein product [Tilletia controversa]|nr:unnamed protein product [Tilletia controversa]
MTASASFMRGTTRSAAGVMVRVADGKSVPATHVADVSAVLRGQDRAQHCVALLHNVLLVPSLDANLLSTHQLARQGFITIILRHSTVLVSPSGLVIQAQIDPSTRAAYFLIQPNHFQGSEEVHANTASVSQKSGDGVPDKAIVDPRAELWHRRTGHAGWAKLKKWVELGLLVGKDAPTMASIGHYLKGGRVCDEYKLAGETQTLEPPSSVLPRPEIEEHVYELDPGRVPDAADGILPLWEPFGTDPSGPQSEIDLATRIRQLERVWEGDSATPSTIMSLDDLGALLDEQEQGPPRASTPPPSKQLRRSSRIRAGARMAHGLSETFDRDEAADDERVAVTHSWD